MMNTLWMHLDCLRFGPDGGKYMMMAEMSLVQGEFWLVRNGDGSATVIRIIEQTHTKGDKRVTAVTCKKERC